MVNLQITTIQVGTTGGTYSGTGAYCSDTVSPYLITSSSQFGSVQVGDIFNANSVYYHVISKTDSSNISCNKVDINSHYTFSNVSFSGFTDWYNIDLNYIKIFKAKITERLLSPNGEMEIEFVSTGAPFLDTNGSSRPLKADDFLVVYATHTDSGGTKEFVAFAGFIKTITKDQIKFKLKLMEGLSRCVESALPSGQETMASMSKVNMYQSGLGVSICPMISTSSGIDYGVSSVLNTDQNPTIPNASFYNSNTWDAMKKVNVASQIPSPSGAVPQHMLVPLNTMSNMTKYTNASYPSHPGGIYGTLSLAPVGYYTTGLTIDKTKCIAPIEWIDTLEDKISSVRSVFAKEVIFETAVNDELRVMVANLPEFDFSGTPIGSPGNTIFNKSLLTAYKNLHYRCKLRTLFQYIYHSSIDSKPRYAIGNTYTLDDTHTGGSGVNKSMTCIAATLDLMTMILDMELADYIPMDDYVGDIQARTSALEHIIDPATGVPSNRGGTGQTAFAKGDLLVGNSGGTGLDKLAIGTDGKWLKVVSGTPSWQTLAVNSSDITWNGNVIPGTDQADMGSATNRWDVFAYNLNVYGTFTPSGNIIGASDGLDLGSGTYKWDLYTNTATVYTKLAASSDAKALGDSTNRFTAHLYDATIYNSLLASADQKVLGGATNRFTAHLYNATIYNSLVPNANNTIDLGSGAASWKTIYADTSIILNGACTLTPTATYNCLRVQATNGWVEIAPRSATYCHFYTDATNYYFDKPIHLDGNLRPYTTGFDLGDTTYRWDAFLTSLDINGSITGTLTPATTGNDLGTTSFRWDAFLTNLNIGGYITGDLSPASNNVDAIGEPDKRWAASYIGNMGATTITPYIYDRTTVCDSASTTSPYTIVGDSGTCSGTSGTPYTVTSSSAFGNMNVYDHFSVNGNVFQCVGKTDSSNITANFISGTTGSWTSQTFYLCVAWYARKGSILTGSNGNTYTITSVTNDYTVVANLTTGSNGSFTNVTMTTPTIDAWINIAQTNPSAAWLRFRKGSSSQHAGCLFSDYDAAHFFLHSHVQCLKVNYSAYKMDSYESNESPIAGQSTNLLNLDKYGNLSIAGEIVGGTFDDRFQMFEDFIISDIVRTPFLTGGSSGSITYTSSSASGNIRVTTGATSGNNYYIYTPNLVFNPTKNTVIEARIGLSHSTYLWTSLGLATDTDIITPTATDYTVFQYTESSGGSSSWGVENSANTGVNWDSAISLLTGDTSYHVFRIEITSSTNIKYYIDGVLKHTSTTYMPDTYMNFYIRCETRTTAARYINVDYVRIYQDR